jgi:hypothetical protein
MKIDNSAFRAGNLLLWHSSEDGWLPTKLDWQDFKLLEEYPESFWSEHKPIPINDEVLSTIAYIGFEFCGYYGIYSISSGDFGLYEFTNDSDGFHITNNNASITTPLKWLHELQNHFYTTTGRELDIDLKMLEVIANKKEPEPRQFVPDTGVDLPF